MIFWGEGIIFWGEGDECLGEGMIFFGGRGISFLGGSRGVDSQAIFFFLGQSSAFSHTFSL